MFWLSSDFVADVKIMKAT